MSSYRLEIKQGTAVQYRVSDNGPVIVPAAAGMLFRVTDMADAKAPDTLMLMRKGLNLEVLVDGSAVAVIEGFYSLDAEGGYQLESGELLAYDDKSSSADASGSEMVGPGTGEEAVWGASIVGSDLFWPVVGGVAAAGAVAVALSGGDDQSESDSGKASDTITQVTVSPFAGPFISNVQVDVYDASGNLLGQGSVDASSGQVVIDISNGYVGPVLVVVTDINGADADYISEATGQATSLDGSLRAMGTASGNGSFSMSVTPLTELATQLAGVPEDVTTLATTPLVAVQVQTNQTVAQLFGVVDILGEAVTVVDGDFDQTDGMSSAESYGDALALLSGMEQNLGGISQLVASLAEEIVVDPATGSATLSDAGNTLLQAGLETFEQGPNADLLDSQSPIADAPVMAEAAGGLNILEASDGTVLTINGVAAGDSLAITLGAASYQVAIDASMLSGDVASVVIPLATLQAAGNGPVSLVASVNGVARPALGLTLDLVAPTLAISVVDTRLSAGETTQVTFVFSEAVSDFSNADIVLESGSLSSVTSTDGGVTWSAIYIPEAAVEDAAMEIRVNPDFVDRVGNHPGDQLDGSTSSAGVADIRIVVDTLAPTFTSAATATATNENSGAGTVVYTATTDDPAATLTLGGADAALFSFNAATGEVTLLADADYESKDSYAFTVTATDAAGNSADQSVTLAVNDLDEVAPVFTSATTAAAIDENTGAGSVVYTATTDDPTATLTLGGADAALFSLNAATGEVTLLANADHETKAGYEFSITATDAAGNASAQTVTLAVNDLDEASPWFTSGATAAAITENSGAGQLVYTASALDNPDVDDGSSAPVTLSLAGIDAALFSLDAARGEITLIDNPDHETRSSYSFDVVATDGAGNTASQTVTFDVVDVDESAPVFTSALAASVAANSGAGQVVYTASATDTADIDDSTDRSTGVTYSLGAPRSELFGINPATGEVTLYANPADNTSYSFNVVATDAAGNRTSQTVTLSAGQVADTTAPVFTSATTAAAIDENTGAGTVVYTATTDDPAATLTLGGTDAALFSFDATTGEVTLLANADHETKAGYEFTITATDVAGNSAAQVVNMAVNDRDESAPVFTSANTGFAVLAAGGGQIVYTATATDTADVDDSTDTSAGVTYSLGAPRSEIYDINSRTGEVTLYANPDSTTAYGFTVVATDASGNSTSQAVTLTVGAGIDTFAPVFWSSTRVAAINENSGAGQVVYTARTDDPTAVLTLGGTDAALFGFNAATWQVTLLASPDHETRSSYEFTITATDAAGNSADRTLTMAINDLDESAPVFVSGTTAAVIDENSGANQLVYTAQATDTADVDSSVDASNQLTYHLDGTDAAAFSIDAATGGVTLIADPDYETRSSYSFDVVATDTAGNETSQTVTLGINDVAEGPAQDTSVVIFDLANGTSSAHSGRQFDADTSYTIYLLPSTDSVDTVSMVMGIWSNAAALGSDDQVIMVGNLTGPHDGAFADGSWGGSLGMAYWRTQYITVTSREDWVTNGSSRWLTMVQHSNVRYETAATLNAGGMLHRETANGSGTQFIWAGQAGNYQVGFASSLPAGLMTSQGLV